jgi:uracil-DNA glycosylase
MRWTERQVAMLGEMGIRLWQRSEPAADLGPARTVEPGAQVEPVAVVCASHDAAVTRIVADAARPSHGAIELGPRPAGVEAMDWPRLREAVAACTACRLCQGRTQTVFGTGNARAHWLIVGEAPGEQEDLQGEPFVGKSGQLLDNMLRAIQLTRGEAEPARQVYIANTLKCRPPGNRNPQPDELAQCEPFLIRQIALLHPKIILAMGRFAVQSLLRSDEPVGRLRGHVHRYQGVPLIVTYHPAYLLRNPQDKARAWDDLCLALETVNAGTAAATSSS